MLKSNRPAYVYSHSHDGRIFYVGSGVGSRPWDDNYRNVRWEAFVQKHGEPHVEIVATYATLKEARARERREIDMHGPLANIIGSETQTIRVSSKARRKLKMRSAKEGKTIIRLVDELAGV